MRSSTASSRPTTRRVLLLGSTGSIGTQTLDVLENLNGLADRGESDLRFEVVGLAAGRNADAALAQARKWDVRDVAIANGDGENDAPDGANVRRGADAAERLVEEVEADVVLAAMVGAAGLPATLAALRKGCDVALANKETLVAAGEIVTRVANETGARLLPVDSEHSAIWQCLPPETAPPSALGTEVSRVVLTASGGPFRTWDASRIRQATPREALAHPTWDMGAKVTIDCASLTNKGFEAIEAHWLFGLGADRIDVVVHPQSIVHSFVDFADGSTLAQLGSPDMRTPIQVALTWPRRARGRAKHVDWTRLERLDFEPPNHDLFPGVRLARDVIERGGVAGAIFNGANEAAVEAFLDGAIPFGRVTQVVEEAIGELVGSGKAPPLVNLDEALAADGEARRYVQKRLR